MQTWLGLQTQILIESNTRRQLPAMRAYFKLMPSNLLFGQGLYFALPENQGVFRRILYNWEHHSLEGHWLGLSIFTHIYYSCLDWIELDCENSKFHDLSLLTWLSLANQFPSQGRYSHCRAAMPAHPTQLFQKFRTAEQIYTFKLIFNTLLTLAHPWYFSCCQG